MYDILIKGGVLYDGSASPGITGDLAIQDGRIARIAASLGVTVQVHGIRTGEDLPAAFEWTTEDFDLSIAVGTSRTLSRVGRMSTFGTKADIHPIDRSVTTHFDISRNDFGSRHNAVPSAGLPVAGGSVA